MLLVKLNLNNLKYLFFLPLWIFTYGILFWVVLDVSFVMQAIIAVTLQQKFHLADKESSSVLKESRTPVKLSCICLAGIQERKLNLVGSALESSCEFCWHKKKSLVATN